MDKISQEILDELQNALTKIETATGNIYAITLMSLDKFDNNPDYESLTVGDSRDSNISIEIYDSVLEYKDFNGIHDNWYDYSNYAPFDLTVIYKLLLHHHNKERFFLTHTDNAHFVGTCRKCNKWKKYTDIYDSHVNFASDYYDKCQVCGKNFTEYKYYQPYIDYDNFSIYNNKGELIAKFKIVRSPAINSMHANSSNKLCAIDTFSIII